jgi:hypothetical protein
MVDAFGDHPILPLLPGVVLKGLIKPIGDELAEGTTSTRDVFISTPNS